MASLMCGWPIDEYDNEDQGNNWNSCVLRYVWARARATTEWGQKKKRRHTNYLINLPEGRENANSHSLLSLAFNSFRAPYRIHPRVACTQSCGAVTFFASQIALDGGSIWRAGPPNGGCNRACVFRSSETNHSKVSCVTATH